MKLKIAAAMGNKVQSIIKQQIAASIDKSLASVAEAANLSDMIRDAPPLDQSVTLWRGERLNVDIFFRPKNDRQRSKHAFAMHDLKKGDTFVRPDFSSFSFDIATSYQFTDRGCCLFKFTAKKGCNAIIFPPDSEPYEYECVVQKGTCFRVTAVRDVVSTLSEHATFRVIEIAEAWP
jgi:hypothetical protein